MSGSNRRYPTSDGSGDSRLQNNNRSKSSQSGGSTPYSSVPNSPRPLLPPPRGVQPTPQSRRPPTDISQISNLGSIHLSNPYLPLAGLGSRTPSTSNLIQPSSVPVSAVSSASSGRIPKTPSKDNLLEETPERTSRNPSSKSSPAQSPNVRTDASKSASPQRSVRSGHSSSSSFNRHNAPHAPPRSQNDFKPSYISSSKPPFTPIDQNTVISTTKLDNSKPPDDEELETPTSRKVWLILVYILTFYLPDVTLAFFAKIFIKVFRMAPRRRDQSLATNPALRLAFREKIALCTLILFLNLAAVLTIMTIEWFMCPETWNMYQRNWLIARREEVKGLRFYGKSVLSRYGLLYSENKFNDGFGFDVNNNDGNEVAWYPRTNQFTYRLCTRLKNDNIQRIRRETDNVLDVSLRYDPYAKETPVGNIVYSLNEVNYRNDALVNGAWLMIDKDIFNVTELYLGIYPAFFNEETLQYFKENAGREINSAKLEAMDPGATHCLRQAFAIGKVDFRQKVQCLLTANISTALLSFILLVIFVKFCAAVSLIGCKRKTPVFEDYIRSSPGSSAHSSIDSKPPSLKTSNPSYPMVIMFVPCYTEDYGSLSRTLQSLALTDYPDDRKLLWIICDGLCVGRNNSDTTAQIILKVLGVSKNDSSNGINMPYVSLAEGPLFINYAQVFSGTYKIPSRSRTVPFILCIKTGDSTRILKSGNSANENGERPGNRGKRDSQTILMRFLNKVHYKRRMTPMELELSYHFHRNLGMDPKEFEFMMMVDADTEVSTNCIREFVRVLRTDKRAMGVCGETTVSNPRDSFISMSQVFEYYISHSMLKAFESLFGNVTCLPGCFSMWKIIDRHRNLPLIASTDLIYDYGEIHVETLHEKNLLLLGEDRCLTTMMLRCFPGMYTRYTPETACRTTVPNRFFVLASQRRRWINSTIHNMLELLSVPDLCGVCIFGMRFIVLLDLLSTLIAPGSFVFLVYIIYQCFMSPMPPYTAVLVLAGIYFLQGLIALLQGRFIQLAWLWVHVVTYPLYNFVLPIIAFWQFDNFSWGTTRRIRRARPARDLEDLEIEAPERPGDNFKGEKLMLEHWNPNDLSWRKKYASKMPREAVSKSGSTREDLRLAERDLSEFILALSPTSPGSPRKRK